MAHESAPVFSNIICRCISLLLSRCGMFYRFNLEEQRLKHSNDVHTSNPGKYHWNLLERERESVCLHICVDSISLPMQTLQLLSIVLYQAFF